MRSFEMNRPPITATGAERLRVELGRLKTQVRPQIIAAISEARAHGDLKENAEYHAAKEQQSFNEGRIAEIEDILSRSQTIDPSTLNAGGKVVFGATVQLVDLESDEERTYQLVGEIEADIKQGLISITSPVARALIGRVEGDVVVVNAPGGEREYEVIGVSYV
jgi:transcription elongation factor GreA